MGAYKQFLSSDIIVTPLEVNKLFYFEGAAALTSSVVGIDRYLGTNVPYGNFIPQTAPVTGQITIQYQELVYNSIKQLYYTNYLNSTASYGGSLNTASLDPGSEISGDRFTGPTSSIGRFYNYPQTTLTFEKYFPTTSGSQIGVMSVPVGVFGVSIQPNSFKWKADSGSISDDGEGNLIFDPSGKICGNIFYGQGIAVITSDSEPLGDSWGSGIYGSSLYGVNDNIIIDNFVTSSNVTCSFSSSLIIYETQYKCTARENEFNFSQNPTIASGSTSNSSSVGTFYTPDQYVYNFTTASYFMPYVTTVGLYNESYQLLAVGKLAQPLPLSQTTDTTILINIDR
jgi:hypothetical protein